MIPTTTSRKLATRSFSLYAALLGAVAMAGPFHAADAEEAIVFAHDASFDPTASMPNYIHPRKALDIDGAYYLPDPSRTYNGFGNEQIKIVQALGSAPGHYYVYIDGVGGNPYEKDHVIVQAVGNDNAFCTFVSTPLDDFIHLECTKPTAFMLRVVDDPDNGDNNAIYVTTRGNYQGGVVAVNADGASYDATTLSNGVHRFNIPDLSRRGTAHVIPRTHGARCTVRNHSTGVDVACFRSRSEGDWRVDPSIDFTLIYEEHEHVGNVAISLGGGETYLTTNPSWYPMRNYHLFNGVQVPYSIYLEETELGTPGLYGVRYSGIGSHVFNYHTVPFVTASYRYTPSSHYCKPVTLWGDTQQESTGYLLVRCFDESGDPTSGHFMQNLLWWF